MYHAKQEASINVVIMGILTLMYFIIEVIINYNIYYQLSTSSNLMAIDSLEFWGKIVTGMGMALVLTRLTVVTPEMIDRSPHLAEKLRSPSKVFRYLCVVCIPFSFFLQHQIINKIVDSSTLDEQNRALLVSTVQRTIVPYYDFSNTSSQVKISPLKPHEKFLYPFNSKANSAFNNVDKDYYTYQHYYRAAYKDCVPASREALGMTDSLNRAFFAYTALKTAPQNADKYKALVKDHYECLLSNNRFLDTHTENVSYGKTMLVQLYENFFLPGSFEWQEGTRFSKDAADKEWRKRVDELFGFKTTIQPYTSRDEEARFSYFTKHPDVKRFYKENAASSVKGIYPYDPGYAEKKAAVIVDSLPESFIPTYLDYSPSDSSETGYEMAERTGTKPPAHLEQPEAIGRAAYKAVVMPMVGMGLSAFFLIFNIVIFLFSVIKQRTSKKVAVIYLCAAMFLTMALPLVPIFDDFNDNTLIHDQALKTKWLYHQEGLLSNIYDIFIGDE